MAKIRGWKRTADNRLYKRYKHKHKNGDTTVVTIFNDNTVWIERNEAGNLSYATTLLKKRFKTKGQAINYAISWMKRHPYG